MLLDVSLIDPLYSWIPWVVLLPLAGLLLNLLIGRRIGEVGVGLIASLAALAAFGLSVLLSLKLAAHPEAVVIRLAEWMQVAEFSLAWDFRLDTLSATMMLVVSGVGSLIHIYATAYMHRDVRHNGDPGRYRRFFVFFNLFLVAMLLLVTANNYLMLFVGWEGVGLCSYLLIGFWFEKGEGGLGNARAAKKAFIVNRIGDFGLLIALFLLFWHFGSLDFETVFAQAPQVAAAMPGVVLAITLFMLLGVVGKSAQLPLYVWLPDAMAGPTPVSALIHAATMVTAGVYLIARSAALYLASPLAAEVVAWVGVLTALFAATIAVAQFDIKKVLAYSTISQLGFMVAAAGMGAFVAGIFHLATHAFFKALLFLSAGSVIQGLERGLEKDAHGHGHEDVQDMRNMGGLRRKMPLTFWVYLTGGLALAGIAPLAGFFSKDEILAAASKLSPVFYGLLIAAALLTAFYVGRQLLLVFFGEARSPAAKEAVESPPLITLPLVLLALLSLGGGLLNFPGLYTLDGWLEHTIGGNLHVKFDWAVALPSLGLALFGLLLAWLVYGRRPLASPSHPDPLAKTLGGLFTALQNKWWVDELYHLVIVRPFNALSHFFAYPFDLGVIDALGNGLGSLARSAAWFGRRLQNGYVRSYALTVLFGVAAILTYLILR